MQVTINIPFKVSKTNMDFWDFMIEILQKYEDIEDLMLSKIAKESDQGDYVDKNCLLDHLSK